MILHTLKIIWTEKKVNIWILVELFLVFCILWFCVDYMYFFVKKYFESEGFDIEHVYSINLGIKDNGQENINSEGEISKDDLFENIWIIFDRIKGYPEVENACMSIASVPYSGSNMSREVFYDTIIEYPQIKSVTPEFFDVFKINLERGKVFSGDNMNEAVISGNIDNIFLQKDVMQIDTINYGDHSATDYKRLKITGIARKSKRSQFESFLNILYLPLAKSEALLGEETFLIFIRSIQISVRIKPGADKGFEERFTKNMLEQTAVGPYFLSSVQSFKDIRKNFIKNGWDSNFKSIYSISAFLFINIFLAVAGTFWFRIQSRRSEIGLRIALGASAARIRNLFICETLILLFIASIVAAFICVNISLIDVLNDIGVPSINRKWNPIETSEYFINYGITFVIIAIIAIGGVWYPAWRASKIQPAQALKDE
ncbi:ABC transporter permease [Prevotella sp. 10(H)]|uniref:ABC transporter permease n=1 Tax=Prevotella sp. 10(H) TaxID=1158294 RepID=UPI0004A76E42|nr:ABC transporter permease [Prevotella sp. 10(H)]